ncbi:unnamed protein product [Schistosoma margrebowiei]|uniref:Uncharacterized protein n=1 Tax=Schistosoma margrebowiei TaxID=48269 RepID=A0A183MW03_9TREM|nr:unnamed protein product [Schistosoma margrebowiei]
MTDINKENGPVGCTTKANVTEFCLRQSFSQIMKNRQSISSQKGRFGAVKCKILDKKKDLHHLHIFRHQTRSFSVNAEKAISSVNDIEKDEEYLKKAHKEYTDEIHLKSRL